MLKTFALRMRETPLTIYGPPGLEELFASLKRVFGRLTYPVELAEVRPGDVLERDGYRLLVFPVAHGVSAVGYALVEDERPGRFDVAIADELGVPFGPERGRLQRGEAVTLADGSTVTPEQLVGAARGRGGRSSTPATPRRQRRSACSSRAPTSSSTRRRSPRTSATAPRDTMHSTAVQAAEVARDAGVSLLALTHVSPRYFGPELLREAREVFPSAILPRDFDIVEVPFRERGEPTLVKGGALPERDAADGPARHRREAGPSGFDRRAARYEELRPVDDNWWEVFDALVAARRAARRARARGRLRDGPAVAGARRARARARLGGRRLDRRWSSGRRSSA